MNRTAAAATVELVDVIRPFACIVDSLARLFAASCSVQFSPCLSHSSSWHLRSNFVIVYRNRRGSPGKFQNTTVASVSVLATSETSATNANETAEQSTKERVRTWRKKYREEFFRFQPQFLAEPLDHSSRFSACGTPQLIGQSATSTGCQR